MTDQMNTELTSNDKLWALLIYVLTPLVPIIVLLMEDKKNHPFLKAHTVQSLIVGVISLILSVTGVLACVSIIIWIICIYWGIQAYGGKYVEIPVITNFVKNKGWA